LIEAIFIFLSYDLFIVQSDFFRVITQLNTFLLEHNLKTEIVTPLASKIIYDNLFEQTQTFPEKCVFQVKTLLHGAIDLLIRPKNHFSPLPIKPNLEKKIFQNLLVLFFGVLIGNCDPKGAGLDC
jgi:hypothetical protein